MPLRKVMPGPGKWLSGCLRARQLANLGLSPDSFLERNGKHQEEADLKTVQAMETKTCLFYASQPKPNSPLHPEPGSQNYFISLETNLLRLDNVGSFIGSAVIYALSQFQLSVKVILGTS